MSVDRNPTPHPLSNEAVELDRQARVRDYISRITPADWARIRALARQVTDIYCPARLEDLEARGIAVGVRLAASIAGSSGLRIGTVRNGEVEVLVWEK